MNGDVFRREDGADSNQFGIFAGHQHARRADTGYQYGGGFFSRCAFAASIHHARSSANRGNACASALPPSPSGLPSTDRVCAIGPAAIVLEITTMPISDNMPCHAVAARTPEKRPAE